LGGGVVAAGVAGAGGEPCERERQCVEVQMQREKIVAVQNRAAAPLLTATHDVGCWWGAGGI
jgi:hypothetical protein